MEIIQMKIGDIKPYKKNAKKHPQSQIEAVAKSIKEFGFNQPWQHEPILYGWNPSDSHKWYGGRKQTTVDLAKCFDVEETDEGTIVYVNGESLLVKGDNIEVTPCEGSLILAEKPLINKDHPTMKPIELISRMLINSSRVGDLVLDLFGGSGSTLISCEKLQRRCNIMELDPVYMDVIIRRWEKLTGNKAIKLT